VIGAQLKNLGVPMDEVAGKTNDLVKLGADLSATYGGTTAQAVEALSSVLKGETDPIEKYGISIKQATIAAEMAKEGTDKLTGAAAKQAKTQATLNLVMQQSGPAVGAFGREADTAAGQQQRMTANIENAKSAIGQGLLPVVALFANKLAVVAKWAEKNSTLVAVLVGVLGALAGAILVVNAALKVYEATMIVVQAVQKATWLGALGPIGLVIIAVMAVVAVIVILWKKSETFRKIVLAVWAAIKGAALATARALSAAWRAVWSVLQAGAQRFAAAAKAVWSAIRSAVSAVASAVKAVWRAVWSAASAYVRAYVAVVKAVLSGIRDVARAVADGVKSAWSGVWNTLEAAARAAGKVLTAPFDALHNAISNVIGMVENLIGALSRIHVPKISLPHIPGLNMAAAPAGIGPATYARTTSRAGPGGTPAGPGTVINIYGAIDPEGTARAVRRVLEGHDRRVGLRVS
jgi:phage-related protein